LTLHLVLDGEAAEANARALNYVSLVGLEGKTVTLRDETDQRTFHLQPKLIINAAGPWIDKANRSLSLTTHYIGPTKGSHLVLNNPELRQAIGDHEFFFENKDGRIVLIFPLFDKVMVGTSDIPIEEPDSICTTEEEVDYFIEMVGRVFPDIKVDRNQIVYTFCGVRPLAYTQARNAGQITRDHHIQVDKVGEIPVYSLVGGKWTSFRAFSEQVTDKTLAFLGRPRKIDTKDLPIGQGGEAGELKQDSTYTRAEIARMARSEMIVHLDDLLLRRTLLAYLGLLSRPLVEQLAGWLGEALGWTEAHKETEIRRSLDILTDEHGIRF